MSIKKDTHEKCIEDIIIDCNSKKKTTKTCCNKAKPSIHINCKLKVDFNTENSMIYLQPGKCQFFTVNIKKSCGDVIIKCNDCCKKNEVCGNLGVYHIIKSGILVQTYRRLDTRKNDFLNFTAIDTCTNERYDFVVVFGCSSYKRSCK